MKAKNSFSFVTNILYKIYEDCVLLSNKLRNRHIRVDDINKKIKDLNYKEIVTLALSIQGIKQVTDITQLKGTIITNNFMLKLKK